VKLFGNLPEREHAIWWSCPLYNLNYFKLLQCKKWMHPSSTARLRNSNAWAWLREKHMDLFLFFSFSCWRMKNSTSHQYIYMLNNLAVSLVPQTLYGCIFLYHSNLWKPPLSEFVKSTGPAFIFFHVFKSFVSWLIMISPYNSSYHKFVVAFLCNLHFFLIIFLHSFPEWKKSIMLHGKLTAV